MFQCQLCGKTTEPHVSLKRVTISERKVTYQYSRKTTQGKEPIKIISICPECAKKPLETPSVLGFKTIEVKETFTPYFLKRQKYEAKKEKYMTKRNERDYE